MIVLYSRQYCTEPYHEITHCILMDGLNEGINMFGHMICTPISCARFAVFGVGTLGDLLVT